MLKSNDRDFVRHRQRKSCEDGRRDRREAALQAKECLQRLEAGRRERIPPTPESLDGHTAANTRSEGFCPTVREHVCFKPPSL